MKFSAVLAFAALQISAASALVITGRAGGPGDGPARCAEEQAKEGHYNGGFSQACVNLVDDCVNKINSTQSTAVWSERSCVAAATCDGTINTVIRASCANENIGSQDQLDHLDYNIYAGIVGDCAWQDGGCPITQQNYIDFLYGSLSAINSSVYPDTVDEVINTWWNPIKTWAATGDSVPYTNFDDWLHYSNSQ